MLPNPKFFDSPSKAREALKRVLRERNINLKILELWARIDPEQGKWFGIVSLDTDRYSVLEEARKTLPEFRVIGEL